MLDQAPASAGSLWNGDVDQYGDLLPPHRGPAAVAASPPPADDLSLQLARSTFADGLDRADHEAAVRRMLARRAC